MAETVSKLPVKTEGKETEEKGTALQEWRPFESLRREVDRLFEDFDRGWRFPFGRSVFAFEPFWRRQLTWGAAPAADIVEKDNTYEVTVELPGMDDLGSLEG